jgi:hypothetical protein
MIVGVGKNTQTGDGTMETTIKEFKLNDSNMAELVENSDTADYTVCYMIDRVLGFKIFENMCQANSFFLAVKSKIIVDNS